jgi:Bacteriophage replication protein O
MPDAMVALLELMSRENLNKRQGKVVAAIALETIANGRIETELPSSRLAEITGLDGRHVRQTLMCLERRELIRRNGPSNRAARISLNHPDVEPTPAIAPAEARPALSVVNGQRDGHRVTCGATENARDSRDVKLAGTENAPELKNTLRDALAAQKRERPDPPDAA